ncbi:MAG: hypothetical protein ABI586_10160, partial [Candidatus Nanopelagicales bacterium]
MCASCAKPQLVVTGGRSGPIDLMLAGWIVLAIAVVSAMASAYAYFADAWLLFAGGVTMTVWCAVCGVACQLVGWGRAQSAVRKPVARHRLSATRL